MALPPIFNSGKHDDLLRKSQSELFDIIEATMTIAALHWPEKLHAQEHSVLHSLNIARRYAKSDADDDTSDSDPVPAEEPPMKPTKPTETLTKPTESPTKPTKPPTKPTEPPTKTHIIRLRVRSSPTKPGNTTTTTAGKGTATVPDSAQAMERKEEANKEEDYEKRLENAKRKLQQGYNKLDDSRKRSKVIDFWRDVPAESKVQASEKLPPAAATKKTAKATAGARRIGGGNPKALRTNLGRSTLSRCC